ncbi:MAG TPA: hypothetical protein VHB27_21660 [Rhodopila sp.]|uniref:hypothetical protein n=1 Tax=Rhodopila sp. TaxID=2480087 RepID=UPI002C689C43|nr:hypothetical protein [Rhodopila sp.]HVY17841.1 hypothetical protein [Rhodopila sp.]
MLSLKRFTSLANSYGADPARWPAETRADAQALIAASAEARAVLSAARAEDVMIGAARRREEAMLWRPGEQDAALARLRSGVADRIAASPSPRPGQARHGWGMVSDGSLLRMQLGWFGLAASGGFAVAAGLLIGSLFSAAPNPTDLLAVFQATPIHIIVD